MQQFDLPIKNKTSILALGAESAGNFSIYLPSSCPSPLNKGGIKGGSSIYFSEDFGDLLNHANYREFEKKLSEFLRQEKIKPEIILTDLHPLYKTTALGEKLAKKYRAKHIQIQHHIAHIFSAYGEGIISNLKFQISNSFVGIALDGTGYGLDGNIWGGEILEVRSTKSKVQSIKRIGHLEDQTMIGGDLAVKEPARMLISILAKFLTKDEIYKPIKKFYTRNQFELLYNQLQSGFNCQETSSTGRILDAASVLLGFSENQRNFKHEPAILLEQNSTKPYTDLKPRIIKNPPLPPFYKGEGPSPFSKGRDGEGFLYQLDTTYLFKYILKYIHKDKHRLAATAQLYIAEGLYDIAKTQNTKHKSQIFLAGGITNNKIISEYLIPKGAIANNIIPRGDAGISFGQIIYYLTNPRH